MDVQEVTSPAQLAASEAEWDDLAGSAIEKNVFYESWMLLPALKYLGEEEVKVLLIRGDAHDRTLMGLFPLTAARTYRHAPISHYQLWKYIHCYLCTPLLRRGAADEALRALLHWFDERSSLFHMNYCRADGPFAAALQRVLRDEQRWVDVTDRHVRPRLDRSIGRERYLHDVLGGDERRKLRSRERHLMQLGPVAKTTLSEAAELPAWIEDFLTLESSGWKGKAGTAMRTTERDQHYFAEVCREAFRRGQLLMYKLSLHGRPIAMSCNLLSGGNAFIFKIAYDEAYAKYSPGALLGLEKTMALLDLGQAGEVDSCSAPGPSVWSQLWDGQAELRSLAISSPRLPSKLLVTCGSILKTVASSYRAAMRIRLGRGAAARG